jgi:MBG domain (YGX type)/Bacterial Ig-like domain (group 3)/Dockerin type I domain
VQFVVDGTDLGGAISLSGGMATSPSTTLLGAGSHTVVADYSGDPSYTANTGSYTQNVNQATLTLVADNQQMNHYAAVPTLTYHYSGFVNSDTATTAGITATVSLSTTATSKSSAGYYPITATVASFAAPNYVLGGVTDGSLTAKPTVMAIRVDYGKTSMSLIGLSRDLPFIDITAIDVVFSDNVNVSSSMLQLLGVKVARYSFHSFSYNAKTFAAIWTLPTPIGIDRLMLKLNGEVAPPVTGSGANIAANAFSDSFAVLPGNVNGGGVVTVTDANTVKNDMNARKYSVWADVDGNGVVNQTDYNNVKKRIGNRLP